MTEEANRRRTAQFAAHDVRLDAHDKKFRRVDTQIGAHDVGLAQIRAEAEKQLAEVQRQAGKQDILIDQVADHESRLDETKGILVLHGEIIAKHTDHNTAQDKRLSDIEASKGKAIDWAGAFTFAAIAAVISGICFYLLVFQANWDPFLLVQDGNIGAVKDKVYTILVYHVVVYTLVVTAAVFAVCVCTMSKPAVKPKQNKSDAKAKTEKPKANTAGKSAKAKNDDTVDKTEEMPAVKKPTPSAPTTGLKPPPGGRTLEQVYEDSK